MLTREELLLVRRRKHEGETAEPSTERENSNANVRKEGRGFPSAVQRSSGEDPTTSHFSRNTRAVCPLLLLPGWSQPCARGSGGGNSLSREPPANPRPAEKGTRKAIKPEL